MDIVDELRRLLRTDNVRKGLTHVGSAVQAMRMFVKLRRLEQGDAEDAPITAEHGAMAAFRELIRPLLIDPLPKPLVVMSEDLLNLVVEEFCDYDFASDCTEQMKSDYRNNTDSFLNRLAELPLAYHRSGPLQVGTGSFVTLRDDEIAIGFEPLEIFDSESMFRVHLIGTLPSAVGAGGKTGDLYRNAYIQVEAARCTPLSFQAAVAEFRPAVASLIESGVSLADAYRNQFLHDADAGTTFERFSQAIDLAAVLVQNDALGPYFEFIPDCLTCYFAHPPKKDSMLRRFATATRLLVQADQQAETNVGLALSIAAVESLLCRKAPDVTTMFAENAAALLEPDPRERSNAVKWCKKLYGLRSDVLHGTGFNATHGNVRDARMLAAAVLKGMTERRAFVQRMGGCDETPDDLLKELAGEKYTPAQPVGVEETPLVSAWRSN